MTDFIATYRLQFRPGFGFADAAGIVSYLAALGISHIYASPIFRARPGSPHGYDGVDPNVLNPELGSAAAWEDLVRRRRAAGLGWLQDIVPNHMAFHADNGLLTDIFEHGPASRYHGFFDIDWHHPSEDLADRVMAPFLGHRYRECLQNGDIRVFFDAEGFAALVYDEMRFPLAVGSYLHILDPPGTALRKPLSDGDPDVQRWDDALDALESLDIVEDAALRREEARGIKESLWDLYRHNAGIRGHIDACLKRLNGKPGDLERFHALDRLLARQHFRLCWWKNANEEINYRRFFDINELIALRQENPAVFGHTHDRLLKMAAAGLLDGVRIDHVDGLAAPGAYLHRLRKRLGNEAAILVEKILGPEEALVGDWPVQGTTGYDFAFWLNGLFIQRENEERFNAVYESFTGRRASFEEVVRQAKHEILATRLVGDLDNLVRRMQAIAAAECFAGHLTANRLKAALSELLACFPTYRTYFGEAGPPPADHEALKKAASHAVRHQPDRASEIAFIRDLLEAETICRRSPEAERYDSLRLGAIRAFQQLSAALMAKGCEDTAFYRYHRLLSLNEVGGEPGRFGCGRAAFHAVIARRAATWPEAMNSTATHDSKRGEDVRARLNVLSEMPESWSRRLERWHALTRDLRPRVGGEAVPDRNTAYLLFQTMIGVWPEDGQVDAAFVERIRAYLIKAVREAGEATSWIEPREDYEAALTTFVDTITASATDNPFRADFAPFCREIAFYGRFNALAQCLIKATAPGIPDFYQGTELWQLALVDPDNRRPVAYDARQRMLAAFDDAADDPRSLAAAQLQPVDEGRIKLFLTVRSLQARRRHGALFRSGDYLPLDALGAFSRHVVAFARKRAGLWALVVAPRFLSALVQEGRLPLGREVWQDTTVALPSAAPRTWRNVFTRETVQSTTDLAVADILTHFPAALLIGEVTP